MGNNYSSVVHPQVLNRRANQAFHTHRIHFALVVPHIYVTMNKRLIDGNSMFRINDEHASEQVARLARLQPAVLAWVAGEQDIREQPVEGVPGIAGPILDIIPYGRLKPRHKRRRRRSQLFYFFFDRRSTGRDSTYECGGYTRACACVVG